MDLKDLFAAHVAAALAHRIEWPDVIATRAYDLADALLRERARRSPSNDEELLRGAPLDAFDDGVPDDEFFRFTAGLLDEPAPLSDRESRHDVLILREPLRRPEERRPTQAVHQQPVRPRHDAAHQRSTGGFVDPARPRGGPGP